MRALLDVSFLIALLDPDHVSNAAAHAWFAEHGDEGWASCPITQNGCVRIMSGRNYPNALTIHGVTQRLGQACSTPWHEFWPDDISWLDGGRIDPTHAHGPAQLTDLYLLALAVKRGGRLVTFDRRISLRAVSNARPQHLLVL